MFKDYTIFLWLLKLGALVNFYFLANSFAVGSPVSSSFTAGSTNAHLVIPARILFAVSAYRCLFPVRYIDNIVFHRTPLSSIFLTRVLATFAEVAFIYQFSHVIRELNADQASWVNSLSWLMVVQVVISQFFVWAAIVTKRLALYFFEELGWAIIFAANTIASAYLYSTNPGLGSGEALIQLNLLFGLVYLPWQMIHLHALRSEARNGDRNVETASGVNGSQISQGLIDSIRVRNQASDAKAWGGLVGLTWMVAYWATLIPMWVHYVVQTL